MNFFEFCKAVAALIDDPIEAKRIARGSTDMYQFWDEAWTPKYVAERYNEMKRI